MCSVDGHLGVRLVFLDTADDIDVTRLTARPGHFFPQGSWAARSMIWRCRDRRRIHLSCLPMARQRSSWRRSSIA
jgi:hypothetical protein